MVLMMLNSYCIIVSCASWVNKLLGPSLVPINWDTRNMIDSFGRPHGKDTRHIQPFKRESNLCLPLPREKRQKKSAIGSRA